MNIVCYMWLFMHKFNAYGTLSRYVVAKDRSLKVGIDCDETFSPVVKPDTIQTILSLAISRHWNVHQLDVKNAFLHGNLSETLYMHQPPSFLNPTHPDHKKDATEITVSGHPVKDLTMYCSLAEALQYLTFNRLDISYAIRNVLRELHCPLFSATLVYCDKASVVYMSDNPVQHQRIKHIEINIHFVRDFVINGHVRVLHVPSRYQYADIFTKGLPTALFNEFRTSMSVRPAPTPTAGDVSR
ncbi:uncharacterized protein [Rutidosis leptorrhynchoides]|uniref:uncharacterized protein n=1 Tax=Rutidosis leptorrhynchoides TaxID=125765 RepID=UPI003A9A2ED0